MIEQTLSTYRETVNKINQLIELRSNTYTSGNAQISDMPRGESQVHSLEMCIDARERISKKIFDLTSELLDTLETISKPISKLVPEQRDIITYYYLRCQSTEQICAKMGISRAKFYYVKKFALLSLDLD